MLTLEQLLTCFLRCAELTRFYQTINLVRLDERVNEIYIFAGEELQILIQPNGDWEFINE